MNAFLSSILAAGCALSMVACVTVNGPGQSGSEGGEDLAFPGKTPSGSAPDAGAAKPPPSSGGGGNSGGGTSGSGSGGGATGADSGVTTCPAKVTTADIGEVNPPRDGTQGSCTNAELARVTGKFSDILAAVSPSCASCLFTESTDVTNTQFFVWADAAHVNVSLENFGACMGSPLSGGNAACGKAAEEIESCLEAACPRDATGATTCSTVTDQQCITAALAGACHTYDQNQTTACGGATALKSIFGRCFDQNGSPDPGIKLLCGTN